tara:strand:+ start:8199 stop:8945 length:747 start_codon:yes stop_codon:yes gene_type:complete
MPTNLNARNVTRAGTRLNSGLDTITTFDLVTSAPMQWSENVRMRFTSSQSASNDFLSSEVHTPQFSVNSGSILVDGSSYSNKFTSKHSQFIAPQEGYVKSIQGYISATGSSGCAEESVVISAWSKTVDASGTSSTPMNLIFSQTFTFNGSSDNLVFAVDSKLYGTYSKITMNEMEGVIFSIKRIPKVGALCLKCAASLTMVFESTSKGTREEFMFPSLSSAFNRLNETISSPDSQYKNTPGPIKTISE